jgi:transposase-like protein
MPIKLSHEVEFDEVYIKAGHKGNHQAVVDIGREPRCRGLKGTRGRGTLAQEKPPIFGMIGRSGEVVIRMLENVKQETIQPLIMSCVESGTLIYTDEYVIYSKLEAWGFEHKTVNHSQGEYARDEDGDGFCEVHVNTMEGFWSLLRSWLRPHRGISQEKLPLYLSFFESLHNLKKRGKSAFHGLLGLFL